MRFTKLNYRSSLSRQPHNLAALYADNWDDFGFKTTFLLKFFDSTGLEISVGNVKIAYHGQPQGWTSERIPDQFEILDSHFYSLGQDPEYYKNLVLHFTPDEREQILFALGDVVRYPDRLAMANSNQAFGTSLLRNINPTTISHQYTRILRGEAPLTPYNFAFKKTATPRSAELQIDFAVVPESTPPTNIHILIGRNGVGKTTILNTMIEALITPTNTEEEAGYFVSTRSWYGQNRLSVDEFAGVVSVSFSAFDPFEPPPNQDEPTQGMRYRYIGLKKEPDDQNSQEWALKGKWELCTDLSFSLSICLALEAKRRRWVLAIEKLESDFNFEEMNLLHLLEEFDQDDTEDKSTFRANSSLFFTRMSSGHTIVLSTITQLIETVEERTLVLIDEPEGHLHPPLLSAFTRALSDLLTHRNAVAIIATHSPVVLQEAPRSCVSIINRSRLEATVERPDSETFAENVGTLTRQVFGLEVAKSGFHELLYKAVRAGKTYEEIEQEYADQIGYEGKALLRSLTMARDKGLEY
ncbi:AAA family ATPase [Pseudomonas aeruginosa]